MRFTYSEMWWFTSREFRVALVLMFLARLAYLSVLRVSSNDDEAPLFFAGWRARRGRETMAGREGTWVLREAATSACFWQLRHVPHKPPSSFFGPGNSFVTPHRTVDENAATSKLGIRVVYQRDNIRPCIY